MALCLHRATGLYLSQYWPRCMSPYGTTRPQWVNPKRKGSLLLSGLTLLLIENVQRRATKLILGLTHMTYPDRLQSLELPTLAYRRARGDMIQVFKLMSDKDCYDKSLPNLLTPSTTGLRGHDYKVFMDRPSKDIRKYNFNIRITKNWNSLPSYIVKASNLLNFEKKLDLYWKNQDLMFLDFKSEIKKNLYPDSRVVLDESDVSDSIFP